MYRFVRRVAGRVKRWTLAGSRRRSNRDKWQADWSRNDYDPLWMQRGISQEIQDAVEDGWFPAAGTVLDIGCGEGEVAAWFARRNYQATGVDIAQAAIDRARSQHPTENGRLEFRTADICAAPLDRKYNVLIDRGCFHQIPEADQNAYLRNILAVATPTARLLLFLKAFRGEVKFGDTKERCRITSGLRRLFEPHFVIDRTAETFLDPDNGKNPDLRLPGLVVWMTRQHR